MKTLLGKLLVTVFVIVLIYVLYSLTLYTPEDPCAAQTDVSAAVLADTPGDQDALANRAIIVQGDCPPK